VRVHLAHLFRALGVNSRTQAILVGLKHVETASRLS
jgi:DNA-binding NarL/FixJ family response regulator